MLESYLYTEANITTYKLVQSHLNVGDRLPPVFAERDLAVTMDSILALYHAVKLNFHGKHTCRWTGHSRIHRVLSKVPYCSYDSQLCSTLHHMYLAGVIG